HMRVYASADGHRTEYAPLFAHPHLRAFFFRTRPASRDKRGHGHASLGLSKFLDLIENLVHSPLAESNHEETKSAKIEDRGSKVASNIVVLFSILDLQSSILDPLRYLRGFF